MGEAPKTVLCRECPGRMTRAISLSRLHFRGKGFVITDERSRRGIHGEGSVLHGTGRYAKA